MNRIMFRNLSVIASLIMLTILPGCMSPPQPMDRTTASDSGASLTIVKNPVGTPYKVVCTVENKGVAESIALNDTEVVISGGNTVRRYKRTDALPEDLIAITRVNRVPYDNTESNSDVALFGTSAAPFETVIHLRHPGGGRAKIIWTFAVNDEYVVILANDVFKGIPPIIYARSRDLAVNNTKKVTVD